MIETLIQEMNLDQVYQAFQTPPENTVFLDIRRPEEWAEGVIPGAETIRLNNLNQVLEKLDKSKTYIVICRSGFRSEIACQEMAEAGFKNLFNFADGMLAWYEKGYPTAQVNT